MSSIKPTDKAIKEYHASLHLFAQHEATHEGATETAFSHLLAVTARPHGWALIPKKSLKLKGGKYVIPDGTLQDEFFTRGYWEAKDTADDLDAEIAKKRKKGYPLANTIFEDTRRAILYQNGAETERYDLTKAQQVADLLTRFYAFTEPRPWPSSATACRNSPPGSSREIGIDVFEGWLAILWVSHSQTMRTRHPLLRSDAVTFRSLTFVRSIFECQY